MTTAETRGSRHLTGYAGILAMLLLALWLGGAANACLVMGSVERTLGLLRGWGSRRPCVGVVAGG
jgi:hypothetical protein